MKLFTAILLLVSNVIHAQNCVINNLDSLPFHFKHPGLIGKMYEAIRDNDTSRYQIMLIRSFSQMKRNEAFHIAISSERKIRITALTSDSFLLSQRLSNTDKYDIGFIVKQNMAGGYLYSTCQNVVSSHKKSVLLFYDHTINKWIEYSSLDGYMKEALEENKNYYFLKHLYEFVGNVFKDTGLYKEQ